MTKLRTWLANLLKKAEEVVRPNGGGGPGGTPVP